MMLMMGVIFRIGRLLISWVLAIFCAALGDQPRYYLGGVRWITGRRASLSPCLL